MHPLRLFWAIPWLRINAIADLNPATKKQANTALFALHVWVGNALYALLALHILGALKHQFIDRVAELARTRVGSGAD